MKWLKNKNDSSPHSYWDTSSDIMSSLLLILLLVIVLLILYVVQAPDYTTVEVNPKSDIVEEDGVDEQYVEEDAGHLVVKEDVPYLYTDTLDEEYGKGENTNDYEYENGGFDDEEFDGHAGSAVKVIVEDSETHSPIQEEGVTFELFSSEGRGQILYSYYPTKTPWTSFSTDASGSFYMPQKLVLRDYVLHEVTVPAGYEAAEDVSFTLTEPKSWDDPYIVHVALNSIRSTIEINAVDSVTFEPIAGATYDIVAAEDITTQDGVVRYAEGSVVEQLTSDEEGKARSQTLYLGNYLIQQTAAPEYYAVSKDPVEVTLALDEDSGETTALPVSQQVLCEKTRYTLDVVDELYTEIPVVGAEFGLLKEDNETSVLAVTDENGTLQFEDLDKEASYKLIQNSTMEGYQIVEDPITFYVDENGRIDDEENLENEITNRTLRLSVFVKDALFGNPASGLRVELYNDTNQLVDAWYASDVETISSGMTAGTYKLVVSEGGSSTVSVQIEDTAEIQNLECPVWTTSNILVVGGAAVGIGGIGVGGGLLFKKRRKKKSPAVSGSEDDSADDSTGGVGGAGVDGGLFNKKRMKKKSRDVK